MLEGTVSMSPVLYILVILGAVGAAVGGLTAIAALAWGGYKVVKWIDETRALMPQVVTLIEQMPHVEKMLKTKNGRTIAQVVEDTWERVAHGTEILSEHTQQLQDHSERLQRIEGGIDRGTERLADAGAAIERRLDLAQDEMYAHRAE